MKIKRTFYTLLGFGMTLAVIALVTNINQTSLTCLNSKVNDAKIKTRVKVDEDIFLS